MKIENLNFFLQQINALNTGTNQTMSLSIPELDSLDEDDPTSKEVPDMQYYISYDFYAKDNFHFHKYPHYGYFQGN